MARIGAMPAGAAMATCRHGEVEAETNRDADDDERGFAHCLGWLQVVVEAEGSSEGGEEQRDQEGSCRDAEPGPVGCPQQRQADGEAVAVQAGDSLDLLGPDSGIAAVRGEYEPDQQRCRRYHQHQPDVLQHRYDASVGFESSAAATIPALPRRSTRARLSARPGACGGPPSRPASSVPAARRARSGHRWRAGGRNYLCSGRRGGRVDRDREGRSPDRPARLDATCSDRVDDR
jgi:hypothetical protein